MLKPDEFIIEAFDRASGEHVGNVAIADFRPLFERTNTYRIAVKPHAYEAGWYQAFAYAADNPLVFHAHLSLSLWELPHLIHLLNAAGFVWQVPKLGDYPAHDHPLHYHHPDHHPDHLLRGKASGEADHAW